MRWIDLRSDTVTHPTAEMRHAMANAIVGDDVYGDDETVNRLEALGARILGKEAGLFVPSGTFGNQVAIMTHTKRGDEILVGEDCHVVMHEVGGAAVLSGVQTRMVPAVKGVLDMTRLKHMVRTEDIHYPDTGLICIENAHSSGAAVPLGHMKEVKAFADSKGVPVHLDGARLFNAATALGVPASELAACADSVNICLSKGLCAPVGSLLVGSKSFIDKARKNRKLMGGGLRQAGILAAAGILALEKMADRLIEDHENAKYMAYGLERIAGVHVLRDRMDINMIFFTLPESIIEEKTLIEGLQAEGIKVNGMEDGEYRFVTNHGVERHDIDKVLSVMSSLCLK